MTYPKTQELGPISEVGPETWGPKPWSETWDLRIFLKVEPENQKSNFSQPKIITVYQFAACYFQQKDLLFSFKDL